MSDIRRLRDWRSRLVRYANDVRGCGFVWGETDCVAITRGALVAMFGEPADVALPRWRSKEAALRLVAGGLPSAVLQQLGARRVPLAFHQAGDVLVLPFPDDPEHLEGLAVVVPPGVLVSTPARGAELVPINGLPGEPNSYRLLTLTLSDVG